jgi:hypothetical protein
MLPELPPPPSRFRELEGEEEEEEERRRRALLDDDEAFKKLEIEFDEKTFFFASSPKSPRDAVKNIIDIERRKKTFKTKSPFSGERERGERAGGGRDGGGREFGGRRRDEDGTIQTTTTREKYNRLLLKHQTLKRDFRKLSEDYDYNFALFKERDEELDSLEEQLNAEKKKNRAYRDRIKELEREVALRTL